VIRLEKQNIIDYYLESVKIIDSKIKLNSEIVNEDSS
jgi:hypothetical protein